MPFFFPFSYLILFLSARPFTSSRLLPSPPNLLASAHVPAVMRPGYCTCPPRHSHLPQADGRACPLCQLYMCAPTVRLPSPTVMQALPGVRVCPSWWKRAPQLGGRLHGHGHAPAFPTLAGHGPSRSLGQTQPPLELGST